MKNSEVKEPKPKAQEQKAQAPQLSDDAKSFKQAWKKKEKKKKNQRSREIVENQRALSRLPRLIQLTLLGASQIEMKGLKGT